MAVVASLVVLVDQLTKWWALRELADRDIDLVWTLRLHLEHNTGTAFSLGAGRGGLIAVLAILVVVGVLWWGRAAVTGLGVVAVGLVLGGAIGNLGDRACRHGSGFLGGAVVDFIDLQWWPVFNVADAAITIGGLTLVLVAGRGQSAAPASSSPSS